MVARLHNGASWLRRFGLRVLAMLGRQRWLDRPSYRLEHALTFLFAACGRHRERIANMLHGTWLGHPLHPALTSLPTGAVASVLALDATSVFGRSVTQLRDASRIALGLGLIGSVGAGTTGVTDWQYTHEQARRVGMVHGLLNVVATGLYAMSWWDRGRGRYSRGVACSALGYGMTLGSCYLGGALVYGLGTGVDQSGARLSKDTWTPVLPMMALEGRPQRVEVAGVGVVLYRNDGQVLAVGDHCPHLGAPMSDGWIDEGRIVCPWHGSRFACGSGDVLRGPATAALPSYSTRIRDGMVEVRAAPSAVGTGRGVAQ